MSPMCQYSADDGHITPWHHAHLGGILMRGPGLTFGEATSITPNGRITPQDAGLWDDTQIAPLRALATFAHSQGQHLGIQLAHAGRSASTNAPWLPGSALATEDVGGWPGDVIAPSAIPWAEDYATPMSMTLDDIKAFKEYWRKSVRRAMEAGIDVIEIHAAHGFLLHSFLSPASNQRTDSYGGSFENRVRLTLEICSLTRESIPDSMPLFLRLSATDWLDTNPSFTGESWTVENSCKLAPLLEAAGVDLSDVSSGGNHELQKITRGRDTRCRLRRLKNVHWE